MTRKTAFVVMVIKNKQQIKGESFIFKNNKSDDSMRFDNVGIKS